MDFSGGIQGSASQYKILTTFIQPTGAKLKIVGANPNRVAIMITDGTGGTYVASTPDNLAASKGEIFLTSSVPSVSFTFADFGPYVQGEWWCARNAGLSNLVATEVIYSPSGG